MECKYIVADCTDPYRNLAQEQSLMKHTQKGMFILFLWQNENTIVLGRNQDIYNECRVDEFLETGGRIARRRSGGGAVFHDLGNLNFSIICKNSELIECAYQNLIAEALSEYGIDTDFNGRNDLTYQGRKFSGNAAYKDGDTICQHGTILIHVDIDKMAYFLTPEQSKLDRNHVSSVSSRVINLGEISEKITVQSLKETMIRVTKAEKMEYSPNIAAVEELVQFYSSKSWLNEGER